MNNEDKKKEIFFQLMLEGVKGKYSALLQIATFACALLVIGSFNSNLFPLNDIVRFLLTILLILMLWCLDVYLSDVSQLSSDASEALYGKDGYPTLNWLEGMIYLFTGYEKGKKIDRSFRKRLNSLLPYIALGILWLIVFVLIVLIWQNSDMVNHYLD